MTKNVQYLLASESGTSHIANIITGELKNYDNSRVTQA